MGSTFRLRRLGTGAGLFLAIIGVIVLRYTGRDYRSYFLQQKGSLISYETSQIAQSNLTKTYNVQMRGSHGLVVSAWVRFPHKREGPFPAVLVASGIETGHLVLKMLDERPAVIVMAVRYPYNGEPDFSGFKVIKTLRDMRETGMKTIPSLLLALDYLRQHPSVDTNDIGVATVSFGTFVGVPVAALHPGVKRLIVVQGGGDVASIIASNAKRLNMPLSPKLSGLVGKLFLYPFEPNRYIGQVSPRPLLMVNSPGDLLFPDESANSLFEHAGDPKEIIWHKSQHVMPGALDIIKELTDIVVHKLYRAQVAP